MNAQMKHSELTEEERDLRDAYAQAKAIAQRHYALDRDISTNIHKMFCQRFKIRRNS